MTRLETRSGVGAGRSVPYRVTDPQFIDRERYYDRGFFELEKERLWPKVWQMACRLEEIPAVGDYVEYTICDQSVLVVRTGPDELKAYQNACRHRATQLALGTGTFRGGQIVCPFHGWRWNLDGSSSFVYGEQGFRPECVTEPELRLRECRVETWGGCAFINLDPDARPLLEALDPISSLLDPLGVDRMRVYWWKAIRLKTNWKMAMEAFMEGWHVMQTHPQLTLGRPDEYSADALEYFVHPNGHSCFWNNPGVKPVWDPEHQVESLIESSRLLWEGLDAMTLARDMHVIESLRTRPVPKEGIGAALVSAIFEYAAGAGIPLPMPEDPTALVRWGGVFFLFPNYFILPQYGNALIYRSRPDGDDPESCYFELWSVTIPPAHEPPRKPVLGGVFAPDDTTAWPLIPLQDFSNLERQQRGIHTLSFEGMRLAERYELGISNMHQEVDAYLAR
jgi:phenylpropionate dioxygenase-like ring-hydroxylating dioxygenase large terminal subunit